MIKLVKEYALSMNVSLVKSSQNKADQLTRVPQRWLDATCLHCVRELRLGLTRSRLFINKVVILVSGGHYFVKQIVPRVSKATVKTVIREC